MKIEWPGLGYPLKAGHRRALMFFSINPRSTPGRRVERGFIEKKRTLAPGPALSGWPRIVYQLEDENKTAPSVSIPGTYSKWQVVFMTCLAPSKKTALTPPTPLDCVRLRRPRGRGGSKSGVRARKVVKNRLFDLKYEAQVTVTCLE